jgi:Na+/glutamate symporter
MKPLSSTLDTLAESVANSPPRAVALAGASGTSGSAGWLAEAANATVLIQLASACVGLMGAVVGLIIGFLALRKHFRDDDDQ